MASLREEIAELRRQRDGLLAEVDRLKADLAARDARIAELERVQNTLQGKVRQHAQSLFGRKSEQAAPAGSAAESSGKRSRGQRKGAPGHGRRHQDSLPAVHVTHVLPDEGCRCAICGAPFEEMPDEETSTEIDWKTQVQRVVHHRRKYRRTCCCPGTPRFRTAPAPRKLIRKGLYTPRSIAHVLVEKFLWARPMHKITSGLALAGAHVADGTLAGVLQSVQPLLQPLADAICARNRQSSHLHVDETRWRKLWAAKASQGWLWIFIGDDTTVYLLDDGRDHGVILRHLGLTTGQAAEQLVTLICDFMGAYDAARKAGGLELARCWAHYRRLVLNAGRQFPDDRALQRWVQEWIEMVDDFFRLHRERRAAETGTPEHEAADLALRGCALEMEETRERQLRRRRLPQRARALLDFGAAHWAELLRCLDDPAVAPDNNAAERGLRTPVLGRKNFYGSGAVWSAQLATAAWTVFATVWQHGLNPLTFLIAYLTACADAGGPPTDLARFLPWALSPEDRQRWAKPPEEAPG